MMHEGQLAISADIVRELITEQFPAYRHEVITPLHTSGTDNAIFRIGSQVAARFPLRAADPLAYTKELGSEAAAMAEFAQHAPFATPQPIGIGRASAHYPMPWSLQSWITGKVATPEGLTASTAFANDIARLIASLRAADTRSRRFDGQGRGGHLPDHDDWMEVCFKNSTSLLDVARLRSMWARFRLLPPAGRDVMSHKDLIPANLLIEGDRLVGVLDAGRFGPADPALDLVAAWHLFDRERRDILRAQLGSSEAEWQRGAAWAFQQAMGLVWYYQRSNPVMSALGRSTLGRLLDDADLAGV